MASNKNVKYTFHEHFSGAGMVRAGLGTNWQCTHACDISPKKCHIYRENYGGQHLREGDISQTDIPSAPEARLAWASFPCQDTSLAGGYAGLAGERSGVFWAWIKVVEGMRKAGKPFDIVCVENVRGLLTSNAGTDFVAIGEALAKEGYNFGAALIDAADFLPHSRERLFIVGIRAKKDVLGTIAGKKPNPRWHSNSMILSEKHFTSHARQKWFWLDPPLPKIKKISLSHIITDTPEGVDWHTKDQTKKLIRMMSKENHQKLKEQMIPGERNVGMLYKRMRDGKQRAEIRFDDLAGCLRAASGGSSRQIVVIVKDNEVRSRLISPREAAKLMGLPDTYKLPDIYNDAYQLCGDGVAVPVVRFLSKNIFEPILRRMDE